MKILQYALILGFMVFGSACATSGLGAGVSEAYVKNGHQVFVAKCNGWARKMSDCYKQASMKCNGYFEDLGASNEKSVSEDAYTGVNTYHMRELRFVCKAKNGSSVSLNQ